MDLFDLFDAPTTEETKSAPMDLVNEIYIIVQKHGINLPQEVLVDLASYYQDPPPWAPWTR